MRYGAALLLVVSGWAGCLDANEQRCGDVLCAADQRCVEGAGCVDPGVVDVCAGRDALAACSAGGITDGVCAPTAGGDLLCVPAGLR